MVGQEMPQAAEQAQDSRESGSKETPGVGRWEESDLNA